MNDKSYTFPTIFQSLAIQYCNKHIEKSVTSLVSSMIVLQKYLQNNHLPWYNNLLLENHKI